ncbi:MAG: hypothetical protein ACYTF4_18435, partial [Planctomycetota bacterium]
MDQQRPSQVNVGSGLVRWLCARPWLWGWVLVALTMVSYAPALDGGFVFDDVMYVTGDGRMETLSGLGGIWTEVGGPDYRHQ